MQSTDIILFSGHIYGIVCLAFWVYGLIKLRVDENTMVRYTRNMFVSCIAVFAAKIIWLYGSQYALWKAASGASYLLPPYQPIGYFLQYGFFRFARPEIVALGVACFFFLIFWILQRLSRGRIFYGDEVYGAGIGFIINPWPQNFLIIILVLLSGLLYGIISGFVFKKAASGTILASTRLFWPFWSIVMVFIGNWLVVFLGLDFLRL